MDLFSSLDTDSRITISTKDFRDGLKVTTYKNECSSATNWNFERRGTCMKTSNGWTNTANCKTVNCKKSASVFSLSYNPTEHQHQRQRQWQRQRQRQMLVYGDAWKLVPDPFPSITIDQNWPLTLMLMFGVVIPLTHGYLNVARAWIVFRAPYKVIIRVQQLVLFAAKLALGDTITGHGMP